MIELRRILPYVMTLTLVLPISGPAEAGSRPEVLVRGFRVSGAVFRATFKTFRYTSYAEEHLQTSTALDAQLERLWARAQVEFVEGSLEESRKALRQVVDERWRRSWSESQSRAIFLALMRLAQMAEDPTPWVDAAIQWNWLERPDPVLFPPPLLEVWKNRAEKFLTNQQRWYVPQWQPEYLVLHGVRLRLDGQLFVEVPRFSWQRWELISSVAPPQVGRGELPRAETQPDRPWVVGPCESPRFESGLQDRTLALVSDGCLWRKERGQWIWSAGPSETGALATQGESPYGIVVSEINKPEISTAPSASRWYERRSFWVGVAGFALLSAAAVTYQEMNRTTSSSDRTVTPVHF